MGGIAALIAAAGAAALAIFNVNKTTDKPAIVVAAYISAGVITAAALFAAAIIVSTDIRARTATSQEQSSASPGASSTTAPETDAKTFSDTWNQALSTLKEIRNRLHHKTEDPLSAWLDGSATVPATEQLHPASDRQADHARLQACQSRVLSELEDLVGENDPTKIQNVEAGIRAMLDNMERILEG